MATAWVAGWGVAVRRHHRPLWLDRWADRPLVALGPTWQRLSTHLLSSETPVVVAATLTMVAVALWRARPAWALAVVTGLLAEVVSVQYVLKPLVDRYEIAPNTSFPSSHASLSAVVATLVVISGRAAVVGTSTTVRLARLAWTVTAVLAGAWAIAVSVATIVTSGHLFSDVVAAIPWGFTVGLASCAAADWWEGRGRGRETAGATAPAGHSSS